jgi:hypothetical protein
VPEEEGGEAHRVPAQAAPQVHHHLTQEDAMKHAGARLRKARALVERPSD